MRGSSILALQELSMINIEKQIEYWESGAVED